MKYLPPYDSSDCAPTCLRMIAKFYGKDISSYYLRKITHLGKQGVSIANLGKAAEKIGFRVLIAELSIKYLIDNAPLPCVLFWDKNHFVVLHKIKKSKFFFFSKNDYNFYIADPGVGKVKLTKNQFLTYWSSGQSKGYAMFLEPTVDFYNFEEERASDGVPKLRNSLEFLITYFNRYRRNYLQVILAMLLTALVSLLFPFFTQSIVDEGINKENISFITLVLIFQLGLFITNILTDVVKSNLLLHIGARINISILADFLLKLMKLPISFYDSKISGDIIQRINDHKRIEDFITSTLLTSFFSIVNILVFTFILLSYNKDVFLIFIAGSLCSMLWTFLFLNWRKSLDYRRFRESANSNEKYFETINNISEIKLNNLEKLKQLELQEIQVRLFKINISGLTLEQSQRIGSSFFDEIKNIIITFVSAYAVIKGEMTLGMMLAISYIVGQLNSPIKQLIGLTNVIQSTKIGIDRMNEVYAEKNEEPDFSTNREVIDENFASALDLAKVYFKYGGDESPIVLKNISLSIPKGKITAIVGSSGSGKTTLLKLLLKFYNPIEGKIKLSNYNLETLSSQWWRSKCGTVMQEGHIFSDTIKHNIVMSDEFSNNENLINAAEIANILDFIQDLPLGFETKIGDSGIGLSSGQKQRILIARAVYKDPDFLFFDEATSSLDASNEKKIMDNLNSFFKAKTVVIIAHRLSTVKNADQIVVLEKGEIKEIGTHRELVLKEGYYYNLISNQLELAE